MVLFLVTEISIRTVWWITNSMCRGTYWLIYGSPPTQIDQLNLQIKQMQTVQEELIKSLKNTQETLTTLQNKMITH